MSEHLIANLFTSYSGNHNLVSRKIQILVFFYSFPYLLRTKRESRSWYNSMPITS
uniref:Uncharacterized protein MANES_16G053800 n=1 Tax=Rhizophora mucronata TaxID=61149 RepID=A0A2P2L889_RHIMU